MVDMDTIVSLCKRRGFIFQSSEIYGGLGSAWDYGPLGVEFKNNVKRLWWRDNVQLRDDMVGLDSAITMHPKVWEASGHLASFSDPFTGCAECGRHYREDQLSQAIQECKWFRHLFGAINNFNDISKDLRRWAQNDGRKLAPNLPLVKDLDGTLITARQHYPELINDLPGEIPNLQSNKLLRLVTNGAPRCCPNCGGVKLSEPRPASLMLETFLGPVKETATKTYLRPETAQG